MNKLTNIRNTVTDVLFSLMAEASFVYGAHKAGIRWQRKVVAHRFQYRGDLAPEAIRAQISLAHLLCSGTDGEVVESQQLLAQAREKIAALHGPDRPSYEMGRVLAIEGYIALSSGLLAEADLLCRKSHMNFAWSNYPICPDHAETLSILADVCDARGNNAEATLWRHRADAIRHIYAARLMRRPYR